jgi:hypothetical protein
VPVVGQSAFASLGDDLGLARTDVILGQMLEYQGRFAEAQSVIGSALSLSSGHASARDGGGAREAWEESVLILEVLHHPATVEVRSRLGSRTLRCVGS